MSDEGDRICPLCTEEMDLTDQQLKPCKCGYEICVWCWHQILEMAAKEDTEGRCPACRVPYDKEKIVGMAANCERMAEIHIERKKSQKAKTKSSEGRKQLGSVRVIQRNLVYIVGLPLNLADEDLLQRKEYFGQYGKVQKVSMSRTGTGVIQQFPNNTCSVYITYSKEEEAIRCIQSVHGFVLDSRSLKACFGTTKYCHAWLRNVPCTNPDCLYLHEIGSQEDSFTKDEIISAFTRVQQITGATNNMQRRAGSMLPPPLDDYSCNGSASAPKPIVKITSNTTTSTSKSSPPNGSSGRSLALPAAASWGTRATNQPQAASSTSSNGSTKLKSDTINGPFAFSLAVTSSCQASTLHSDVVKRTPWGDDGQPINGKIKSDPLKPAKQNVDVDFRATILEKPAADDDSDTATVTLSNQSSSPTSKHDEWGSSLVSNGTDSFVHTVPSSEKRGVAAIDMASLKVDDNVTSEVSGITRTSSSLTDHSIMKLPGSPGLQQPFADQYGEPLPSPAIEKTSGPRDQSDWTTDPQIQTATDTVSEVEEDIISFDNQRLKDPEVVSRTSYLPNSANSLHVPSHSRSHSLQLNEPFGGVSVNADPIFLDNRVGDRTLLNASSHTVIANGYPQKLISSSAGLNRNMEHSCLSNEVERKPMGRLQGDVTSLDAGENSIISNILSLDLDSWDESLTSPQHLAKLLGETDKQSNSLKISSSWKGQNNHQSRFSFARQEESRNQGVDADTSFNVFGQLQKNLPFGQDFSESRLAYLDKFEVGNGFSSSNFDESEAFVNGSSVFSSSKSSGVARTQISAPPGFSVPNRAPPPGFSSHERMDQIFDTMSGGHLLDSSSLLRNPYQAAPPGNISSSGDIEFMDPAILAVGKGRLQGGLNTQGLDMRSNFPQQLSAFENDPRLQLLMQRSLSPHQNLRYADIGDNFSSLNDCYGISSRLVDQSQMGNLSPFMQMSLQHSRNGLMSNGHWDGWNELQGANNLGVAEYLRNERLGLNKFYSAGYEDSKFRMPNSGDLYNRTFEM
ncbi:dentin sialophosphoprotein isoform X2 [Ricinus communis]|uniref:dentin sialophosphoprotein isoform X2 n=1 Tax=Ricinus communis TaxID=3988 RepID=UPI00201ACDA0|nr:dentin sialophosphoprotein isoform X2 [Ricinus communis]